MKVSLLSAVLLMTLAQVSHADWVIVQKSSAEGASKDMISKIKGASVRSDIGTEMSAILNGDTGGVMILMHPQKTMMKMDADATKGLMALAGGLLNGNKPAAKPQPTGQKEKVGQWDCEVYTWTGSLGTGKFWVARDFPQAAEINALMDKVTKAMGNPQASFVPSSADFPGMVVKSEVAIMGKTATTELVSVKEEPVDASVFTPPAGYQEMKMPPLPKLPAK